MTKEYTEKTANFRVSVWVPNTPQQHPGTLLTVISLGSWTRMLLLSSKGSLSTSQNTGSTKNHTKGTKETRISWGRMWEERGEGQRLNKASSSTAGTEILYYCSPECVHDLLEKRCQRQAPPKL